MSLGMAALMLAAAQPATPVAFSCEVALMAGPGRFTAPSPVTVSFTTDGKALRDIHVVDVDGILYPGGTLRMVEKADAVEMQSVAVPPERPGSWSGKAEKSMYRLKLSAGPATEWAQIGIGRKPAGPDGRFGMVWNASHQPEGVPQPITGSGGGPCTVKDLK